MFLRAVGLFVALLSCIEGAVPKPPDWPYDPTVPWYKCNHPGTEDTSELYGQTVRSFRHCLNEDQMFKNSYCDRNVSPQAIKVRCMNNTFLPLPSDNDFDWWDAKCHDDEVCVDDDGRIGRNWNRKPEGLIQDSVARCVKPADTAVIWSTNDSWGKHRARWNMIGQDVNYTRLDYIVTVHFLKLDFNTNGLMRHTDLRILDERGIPVMHHAFNIWVPLEDVTYIGFTSLVKGWRQFEVEFKHTPPQLYGSVFTIIDKVAA